MTVERLKDFFIENAGIARPVANTVTRRLLDADKLTRGSRGHAAHHLPAENYANMALAMMVQGDGFDTVTTRIVKRMEDAGSLVFAQPYAVLRGDNWDTETPLVQGRAFADELAHLLVRAADPVTRLELDEVIVGVGVGYSGTAVHAWFDLGPDLEPVGPAILAKGTDTTSFVSGPTGSRLIASRGEATGLVRETYFRWNFIKCLAAFGARDNPKWLSS